MVIIDGNKTDIRIENFSNLEEVLLYATSNSRLNNRVVTDVLLNHKEFSELYPHQAEDISTKEIKSLEIRSVPFGEMAYNITEELLKVTKIISKGSRKSAQLFRKGNDDEALEMLQDVLDVTRDFMSMLGVLRTDFVLINDEKDFIDASEQISALLNDMTEALENEDWVMLADSLEYELIPASERWNILIEDVRKTIKKELGK